MMMALKSSVNDDIDDDIDEAELVAAHYPAPGESTSHHFMITGIVQWQQKIV